MNLLFSPRRGFVQGIYEEVTQNKVFRSTVIFTVLVGFFVHFFILSNYIFNHDTLVLPYTNLDWLLSQGKWFVTPLNSYKGPLALNYLGDTVGIVVAALLAGLLCLIFSIRRKELGWLVGALVVAFPPVATMMLYRSGDYFELAALLAVLAAYFARRDDWFSVLLGIIFLTLSLGAYQAYLGFTASILVLLCMIDLLRQETRWTEVLIRGLRYIGQLLVSIGLYYGVLKLRLQYTGMELSTYKGINNMASNLEPAKLWGSTVGALKNFLGFFFRDNLGEPSRKIAAVYTLLIIILLATVILIVQKRRLYRDLPRCLLLAFLLILCFPLSINIIGVLSANQSYYYITIYPFIMLFISVPILLQECLPSEASAGWNALRRSAALLLVVCVFSWFIRDNQGYHKAFLDNYNIQTKSTALVAQIQSVPGYTTETPVVLAGNTPYLFLASSGTGSAFDSINTSAMGLNSASEEIYADIILQLYIVDHVASNMTFGSVESLSADAQSTMAAMPIYPNSGSIQLVDGMIIVKLGPTE